MSLRTTIILAVSVLIILSTTSGWAAGPEMMKPRVPTDKLEDARSLTNPIPGSPETVRQGQELYEGKGTCANCHGINGSGRGPGAVSFNPPPRNFQHHGFWRHRTEGEIFWVIKNGSPGTAMIPFGGLLSDKEIWSIIHYARTFSGAHRPGPGRGHQNGMGHMGPMGKGEKSGEREGKGMGCSGR